MFILRPATFLASSSWLLCLPRSYFGANFESAHQNCHGNCVNKSGQLNWVPHSPKATKLSVSVRSSFVNQA